MDASTSGVQRVSGSLAMTSAEKTALFALRVVHVAAHVSSTKRTSVSDAWKKGASFSSVTATVTVSEADAPPPSVAVTSSEKSRWPLFSKLSSAAAFDALVSTSSRSEFGAVESAVRKAGVDAPKMPWLLPPAMVKVWLNHSTRRPKVSWSVTVTSALTAAGDTEFSAIVTDRLDTSKTGGSSASTTLIV